MNPLGDKMTRIEEIFHNHSFTVGGTTYCSYDSVYDDMRDLFPQKSHEEICALMEDFNEDV